MYPIASGTSTSLPSVDDAERQSESMLVLRWHLSAMTKLGSSAEAKKGRNFGVVHVGLSRSLQSA